MAAGLLGGAYCGGDGGRGMCVVRASSTICGKGPVGARRMMRVSGPLAAGLGPVGAEGGGRSPGVGLFGSVNGQPAKVPTDRPRLSQPRHRVYPLRCRPAAPRNANAGRWNCRGSHGGDLVAGHHPLTHADQRGVDVAVQRDRAVGVAQLDPHSVAGGRARVDDDPSETAWIGVPIEFARSMPACSTPQRYPKPEVKMPLVGMTNSGCCSLASRWARS